MPYPRVANYYTSWDLTAENLPELALWDVLVLDMEYQVKHPEFLKKLRELNPSIVILAYITSQEVTKGSIPDFQKTAPLRYELIKGLDPSWYLHSFQGEKMSFWPNTFMLNMSLLCPVGRGMTWSSYLARFVAQRIAASGLWDGVLYDNVWQNIDWFAQKHGGLDLNVDARKDSAEFVDTQWRKGYEQLFTDTRRQVPADFLVFGNVGAGHAVYAPLLDGSLIEHFPEFGWAYTMREAEKQKKIGRSHFVILNRTYQAYGTKDDWRSMRFGLASALLIDAFFSFDHGSQHAERWWYDEYALDLGQPVNGPYALNGSKIFNDSSVWRRDFNRGIVVVNPTAKKQTISLGGIFKKMSGIQDKNVNNGQTVGRVTLEPYDGIILQKVPVTENNTVFINGSIAKKISLNGVILSTNEYWYSDSARHHDTVFIGQLLNSSPHQGVKISSSTIEVWSDKKLVFSETPFGKDYNGGLVFAVSSPYDKRPGMFAVAQKKGAAVVLYDGEGKKLTTWFPRGQNYRDGFSLAFADIIGDSREELLVATNGGAPAQIFAYDQKSFFSVVELKPFGEQERAGIAVAGFSATKKQPTTLVAVLKKDKPVARVLTVDGKKIKDFLIPRNPNLSHFEIRVAQHQQPALRVEEY